MDRRSFIASCLTASLLGASSLMALTSNVSAQETDAQNPVPETPAAHENGAAEPFSFEQLTEAMRAKAGEAFTAPEADLPEAIAELTYDQHRAIRFRPDHALWQGEAPFELQAFHMGWLFKEPVRLYSVEEGAAKPIIFTGRDFEYRAPLDPSRFEDIVMTGEAGFRLHYPLNSPDVMDELVSFLGASYFRALGRDTLYGLSARGLAINTATANGEEFPRFTDFYIERPNRRSKELTVYAALDSESVTGAYRFVITPGRSTAMDVTARIFVRKDIERIGIAPMTSMFLFAENNDSAFDDYRGQVHDSDGLKIIRGNGDELWRSLNNPSDLATSFFAEETPRAFGLFQRDRDFGDYQDAGAHYEKRPSLLVEPVGDWGRGAVNLVEIPTKLEVNDNIVAFWVPEKQAKAGEQLEYAYRLTWGAIEEPSDKFARVVALRTGEGGVSGVENKDGLRKFVVDFEGQILRNLSPDSNIEAIVNVNGGEIVHSTVSRIETNGMWRLVIDLKPGGDKPVEMNAHLKLDDQRLSEIWSYQWRKTDDARS
ncbi:glucan biosynthesis protein D [Nitratireductor indicus C115]|uniref:Glucans biosynthesis protein G n=1 Tax=Nitratireductor indicus C115 TaxID=1231190 RepID=K2P2F5_9HYPH|nr:glucan biosynthesis protein [Nitratireductor indicus]EKF41541.1 glucan biosynthesis protein D [Nitratireductor indicus C115]SFQ69889.1 glucans biosynthesis protein [Nitratireductor indicus]